MFIGTDTDGNMFTSFFDLETGAPFIIRYSKQVMVFKSWNARDPLFIKDIEFTVRECFDKKTGQKIKPEIVESKNEAIYF